MATTAYCQPDPEQPETNPCITEPSGIISVAFLLETEALTASVSDLESNAVWTAWETANEAYLLRYTKGEYPGPAWEVDEEGYGEAGEEVKGAKHTMTYEHKGLHIGTSGARTNIVFYNAIGLKSGTYRVAFVDSGHKMFLSDAAVTVKPKEVVSKSKKDQNLWNVEVTWSYPGNPQTYDAPTTLYS